MTEVLKIIIETERIDRYFSSVYSVHWINRIFVGTLLS
jgi:hypothetical protein